MGKFWGVLQLKIWVYVNTILRQLEIFYSHLVYFVTNRDNISILVYCIKEKSGNPDIGW
jgi:hypothetical protein